MSRSRYLEFWEGKYNLDGPHRRSRGWRWRRKHLRRPGDVPFFCRLLRGLGSLVGVS